MASPVRNDVGESLAATVRAYIEHLKLRRMSARYVPESDVIRLFWRSLASRGEGLDVPATPEWAGSILVLLRVHAESRQRDNVDAPPWESEALIRPAPDMAGAGPTLKLVPVYVRPRGRAEANGTGTGPLNDHDPEGSRGVLWGRPRGTGELLMKRPSHPRRGHNQA
jgi:hypothetical protein